MTCIVIGSLVTLLAIWAMVQDPDVRKRLQRDKPAV